MNKTTFRTLFLAGGIWLYTFVTSAQMPGGGMNSAFIKLFSDSPTFNATATIQVFSNRVELLRMPMTFTGLDGTLRLDVDMGQIKSASIPPATMAMEKKFGIDRLSSIVRLDRRETYMLYPSMQACVKAPLTEEDAGVTGEKLVRSAQGRETVDGHPCVRNRSVVKNQKGVTLLQATTWNATDLKNFPLKIETNENGKTSLMHFGTVSFANPDPRWFEVPAGYKEYPSSEDVVAAAAARLAAKNQKK
jgi:hypothetical protein